ncbi:hypothetical protein SAMN05443245_7422 [Paraburkholderia fungorum]|uniref:Uncharacterized protein n=1 Tax=Paraburkholderia fungorum TaxID=134537 RepID=A0A1H1JXR3_9BURK|nr:hypothetical protein [Paraburkholderia fungorum]SDR54417.1 hypothetical protein SAMN05443245_7422 [Paraburkholderia fungorum]
MARHAAFFTRVLAELFPGKPVVTTPTPTSTSTPTPAATRSPSSPVSPSGPRIIGQGADNETHITIADEPNLFVEEADCVVQFRPAFDEQASQTQFGLKILPELAPHWSQVHVHRCSLKDAIRTAIRSPSGATSAAVKAVSVSADAAEAPVSSSASTVRSPEAVPVRRSVQREQRHDTAAVIGRVVSWGEEKFPDRKSGAASRFYTSFAMHLDTVAGERTLQGEGLKEAIAESGCVVGDHVSVRRLRKIKVPAIRADGSPKIVDGQQVMWDKWLWSITK